MRAKFLPLLLLLTISAVLSANIHYASAQHQTLIMIDPCSTCKVKIVNGTFSASFFNGNSTSLENGPYNISAVLTSGYTFRNWSSTSGIMIHNTTANPTNITLLGTGPSTLTLALKAPVTTIQPVPILLIALLTTSLPVMLRRARRSTSPI